MQKQNSIVKKITNKVLSINNTIENYFNQFKTFKTKLKKTDLAGNNKVFFTFAILVFLTIGYFLLPTIYNKNQLETDIENHVLAKYKIDIKFNDKISYGLLPKPHFHSKNLYLLRENNILAKVENFKIFLSIDRFLSLKNLEFQDLAFINSNFEIHTEDFEFFKELFKLNPNNNKIIIKESKFSFINNNDDILFENKIEKSSFSYDFKNLLNIFKSNNEIFGITYDLLIKNDVLNKKIFSEFKSNKIRLNIENELDYGQKFLNGLISVAFANKLNSFEYIIKKNSLIFSSINKKDFFNGSINFKPFNSNVNLSYNRMNFKNFFNKDSLFIDLIKSKIFYNPNLNFNLKLNVKNVVNLNELNNLFLKFQISEGNISPSNSSIMWNDDLLITLKESYINNNEENVNILGKFEIEVQNINSFHKSFQIKKKYRKKIDKIEIDFNYDFIKGSIYFDNVRIDGKSNLKIDKYIDSFNLGEPKIFNKITLKNFVNSLFVIYFG